jgi:hypothetical protein
MMKRVDDPNPKDAPPVQVTGYQPPELAVALATRGLALALTEASPPRAAHSILRASQEVLLGSGAQHPEVAERARLTGFGTQEGSVPREAHQILRAAQATQEVLLGSQHPEVGLHASARGILQTTTTMMMLMLIVMRLIVMLIVMMMMMMSGGLSARRTGAAHRLRDAGGAAAPPGTGAGRAARRVAGLAHRHRPHPRPHGACAGGPRTGARLQVSG